MRDPLVSWSNIVPIEEVDDLLLGSFSCGQVALDRWLQQTGKAAAARNECKVHVCLDSKGIPIAFFTLSSTSINSVDVSRSSRGGISGPIPAILLGKMGVRKDLQTNSGLGTRVLHHAMHYALQSSQYASARFLVVDALSEQLVPWYIKRGFVSIPNMQTRLVCKMKQIERICSSLGKDYFVE